MGVGSAVAGMRPIVEIQIWDFIAMTMDQIVNQAAKFRYMLGGRATVPLVIRGPQGGGIRLAAQHSQSLEAWFAHVPGLVVIAPSTPYDAKGLLTAAIRDDNPVIFLEHKMLYPIKGEVPEGDYVIPLGKADIKRAGTDVTVVATQMMVQRALQVAGDLEKEGVSVEVIDPRTLVPLDEDAILNSVGKTNRLVIVHEAVKRGGFGAEIAAMVSERGLDLLDAPIARVGARNVAHALQRQAGTGHHSLARRHPRRHPLRPLAPTPSPLQGRGQGESWQAGEKGPAARRRRSAAREAYSLYVERAADRRQRSRWALIGSLPYLSLIAAWTFAARSGGIDVIPCAVFACSAPLAITSAVSLPSTTKLQPGIRSPHLSTLGMLASLGRSPRCRGNPTRAPGPYDPTECERACERVADGGASAQRTGATTTSRGVPLRKCSMFSTVRSSPSRMTSGVWPALCGERSRSAERAMGSSVASGSW